MFLIVFVLDVDGPAFTFDTIEISALRPRYFFTTVTDLLYYCKKITKGKWPQRLQQHIKNNVQLNEKYFTAFSPVTSQIRYQTSNKKKIVEYNHHDPSQPPLEKNISYH